MATARIPGPIGLWDPGSRQFDGVFDGLLGAGSIPGPIGTHNECDMRWASGLMPQAFVAANPESATAVNMPARMIAWGSKVSAEFRQRVIAICTELEMNPDHLMSAMAFESGESFSASVKNAAGSGAVGLIQFMPATAVGLGTTTAALAKLSAVEQLDYVRLYFVGYKGKLNTVDDLYMAILWPAGIGKSDDYVLFDRDDEKHATRYTQNKGLDRDKDGKVTKAEAAHAVRAKLTKGLGTGYVG